MTTYYVNAASSGGDGTTTDTSGEHAAFATVAAAQAALTGDQSGNSLLFNRGDTWREEFTIGAYGSAGNPFTIGAYGTGALPRFYGSTQVSTWSDEGSNIWYATCAADPVSVWFVNTNGTIIWGTECAAKEDVTAEYEWWFDDPNNRLYVYAASRPDSRYTSVEKPTRYSCLNSNAKSYLTIQYLDTAFCWLTNDARGIFVYGGTNAIIEYCVCHHHGDLGDGTDPQGNGILVYGNDDLIIRNNTTYENARRGTCIMQNTDQSFDNPIIEHNESYNNYHAQIDIFGHTTGLVAPVIRYNLCYLDSDYGAHGKGVLTTHGIYLKPTVSGATITNADVYYNVVYGMYKDSLIAVDSQTGGSSVTGVEIYNNTVYGAFTGSTWSPGIDIRAASTTSVIVKNNIGMDCVAGCLRIVENDSIDACDNNCWYQSGGGAAIYVDAETGDYHFDNQAAYKLATGWDTDGLWENPDFTTPGSDFSLLAESPCINTGVDVSLTVDYLGHSIVGLPDMGAYEYIPTSSDHVLKRHTGAAWVKAKLMVYNGAAWESRPVKCWDGDSWVDVDALGG